MSIYQPRDLHPEEIAAVNFFDKYRGGAWEKINVLRDYYHETIADAGRYWQHCESTRLILSGIQAEIDGIVEYMVEKYADWASD